MQFELPNEKWEATPVQEDHGITAYIYKREAITDPDGLQVIPNIAFVIESVPDSTDVIVYSMQKRMNMPFEVKEVFSHDDKKAKLKYDFAVGYKGVYKDSHELLHTIYVVHLINGNSGVQVIMDATSELFDQCDKEFIKALRSIEAVGK